MLEAIKMKRKGILSIALAAAMVATACAGTLSANAAASNDSLASQYSTNSAGVGANKSITVDGDIGDWDSSMLIAQGAANDDPRVYRPNSMYEVGVDMYALYGAYDDKNLYLMWEMTNVQDCVAPNDDYPLTQGTLYMNQNFPFFIAIDTGDSSSAIGNNAQLTTSGTIWNSGITWTQPFNKLIAVSTNGSNGPFVYGGNSSGLNAKETHTAATSGVVFKYGKGILSQSIKGIDKGYGKNNNRVVGDVCNESAAWVDFNANGHKSSTMDFHYEMSIPLSTIGTDSSSIKNNGIGVMVVATMGKSALDCLPYDVAMNDNADQPDTESQENNSYEKSDADQITAAFARIGKGGGNTPKPTTKPTESQTQPTTPSGQKGDSNRDGKINIKDVTTIQKYVVKKYTADQLDLVAAEVDGDGEVTIKDATKIQKFVAGLGTLA